MDVIFFEEVHSDDPRTRTKRLIDPAAMLEDVCPLLFVHHYLAFLLYCFFVAADAHDEVRVLEQLFGLFKDSCMSYVVHVENAVGVDSDWVVRIVAVRHTRPYHGIVVLW